MSNKIPRITGDQAIKAFCKVGYSVERQRGSHHILRHANKAGLSIPVHKGQTLGIGLLASKIKDAEITVEEFKALL